MFCSVVKVVLIPIVLEPIVKMLFDKQVEHSVKALPLVSVVAIVVIVAAVVSGKLLK